GGVACAQPVAEVLYRARVLVDETGAVAAADQEFGQGVEERAERIGSEPADVMGPSKEFIEHGWPPRDREKKSSGRASGLCGEVSASAGPRGPGSRPKAEVKTQATPHNQRLCIIPVDRDRGEPCGSTPPTPPGIRVRTTAVRSDYVVDEAAKRGRPTES